MLVVIIAIVFFMGLSYAIYIFNQKPLSFVSISINPDIELAVNDEDIIQEVIPINEDADIITSDLDLVGMDIENASEKIVEAAIETGYIDEYSDENTVVITTTNEDETVRQKLEAKVVTRVNNYFTKKEIYLLVITNGLNDELKSEAKEYGISNGKMLLVNRAATVNSDLSKEELSNMTVKEIQQAIKDYVTERHETLKATSAELKTKWQAEKATLRETYKNKVDTLKNNILKDAGVNTTDMTTKEKNEAISKLLKEKKDKIIESVKEVKKELEDTVQNKTYPAVKSTIQNIRERIKKGLQEE